MTNGPDPIRRLEIKRCVQLPIDELGRLRSASRGEGHRFLDRLVHDWESGENRFDGSGEALFLARTKGEIVGICSLNRDPFTASPTVGRLRRLFVLPPNRRCGVGRSLVRAALAHAREHFETVRLRVGTVDAAAFYEALGFVRRYEDHGTHARDLGTPTDQA